MDRTLTLPESDPSRDLGKVPGQLPPAQYTQRVFDYVRNNIEEEFRSDLSKGARNALIDQSPAFRLIKSNR